jgi:hypothetical protein
VKGLLWSVGGAIPVTCLQVVPLVTDNVIVINTVITYKRKGIYNLHTEDAKKSAVDSAMRGNVSTRAASRLLQVRNTTLQKRVQVAVLQQNFRNTCGKI